MTSPLQSSELQRDPKHEKGDRKEDVEEEKESEPARKIFLGGLSLDASKQTVEDHFSRYGELDDVRVPLHKVLTGKSRGFGFVTFKDAAIAAEVVKMVHKICGREVDVKFAVPRAPSSSPVTTVSDAIADAEQGSTPTDQPVVQSEKMPLHMDNQPSRRISGSGVRRRNQGVATQRTTNNQTSDTNTHQHQNCSGSTTSTVSSATLSSAEVSNSTDGSGAEESSFKIFVGGLAGTVTQAVLRNYFGQFGELSQATVMIDRETNRSRGFGFVSFADATGMHRALRTEVHNINGKPAEVKEAIPRDVLDKQRQQRSQVAVGPTHKSTNVRSASVDMYAFGVPSSIYYFAPHAPVHPHFAVSPKAYASQMPDGSPSGSPRGRAKSHGTRHEMLQSPREESQNATATPVSVIYPPYVAHQHHHAPYSQPGEHVVSPVHYQVPQGAFFYGGPLPFADYNVYGFGVPHFQHAAEVAAARGAHEAAAGNYAYHPHYAHQSQISHMHEQHQQRVYATVNVASTHDGATSKMQSQAPAAAAVPSAAPPAAVPSASSASPSSPSTPTTASSNTSA